MRLRPRPDTQQAGTFVISIDFEMAWGLVHRNGQKTYEIDDERQWLAQLLDLFDRYDIGATWATVGHLLLDGCEPVDGIKHPEISRPTYDWFEGDWFAQDPCSDTAESDRWYAPDVVADILSRPTGHELGCHSFSHLIVGDPATSRGDFSSELMACSEASKRFNAPPLRSFVYPRNTIGFVDELPDHGYTSYRGSRSDPFASLGRWAPVVRLVDKFWPSARSVVNAVWEPTSADSGIWNFPATCLFTTEGRRAPRLWLRQTCRRMDHAARNGGLFHLWFHPHNLVRGGQVSLETLEGLLAHASSLRSAGGLNITTMAALADDLGPRAASSPEPSSHEPSSHEPAPVR